jgi:hypothetical protein
LLFSHAQRSIRLFPKHQIAGVPKGGVLRSETELRKTKAIMRIYDEKGNLVEEVRSKETF